ncbi:hypothetical protein CR513_56437, partial [Mucuna pruriens]
MGLGSIICVAPTRPGAAVAVVIGRSILVIGIVGGQFTPTDRARVMQPKPGKQAVRVVHMFARHLPHLRTLLELVQANGALVQLRVQQLVVDGDCGEILDGFLGGGRCAVAVGVVVGKLLNQLLQAGAEKVVAHVRWEPEPRLGRAIEVELDVGAVRAKVL